MDIGGITITLGSIFAIVGIWLTIYSFLKNNKRDIQDRSSDYAIYKGKVDSIESELKETKSELKEVRLELTQEMRKLDQQVLNKIDKVETKIDDLQKLIINTLKK